LLSFLGGWLNDIHPDAAIKSIVNEYHWSPNIIDNMYLDDFDYHGIFYWYETIKQMHNKLEKP
jgi:hypothetical protein